MKYLTCAFKQIILWCSTCDKHLKCIFSSDEFTCFFDCTPLGKWTLMFTQFPIDVTFCSCYCNSWWVQSLLHTLLGLSGIINKMVSCSLHHSFMGSLKRWQMPRQSNFKANIGWEWNYFRNIYTCLPTQIFHQIQFMPTERDQALSLQKNK